MESRFACFYLTGQLEWILRKFQLAEVVLVVSKPHVFNLTGQLVSKPPEFPTLAATDLTFLASFTLLAQSKLSKNPLPTSFSLCYDDHLRSSTKDSHSLSDPTTLNTPPGDYET